MESQPAILIIGGSSGIGLALARRHAAEGWRVAVAGSSAAKLESIRAEFPAWQTFAADLRDAEARQRLLADIDAAGLRYRRVVYAAGRYLNERVFTLNRDDSAALLAVNLQAFAESFAWAAAHLQNGGAGGEMVCIASSAGLLDYPYASLYAQCKRAMLACADAYRTALAPFSIRVLAVAPGYVDTAALRALNGGNARHKPFLVSEERAVAEILAALSAGRDTLVFPRRMRLLLALCALLPKPLLAWAMRRKLDKKVLHRPPAGGKQ